MATKYVVELTKAQLFMIIQAMQTHETLLIHNSYALTDTHSIQASAYDKICNAYKLTDYYLNWKKENK